MTTIRPVPGSGEWCDLHHAAADVEEDRWARFGGDPRLRVGDPHTSNVGENTDVAPVTLTPEQETS